MSGMAYLYTEPEYDMVDPLAGGGAPPPTTVIDAAAKPVPRQNASPPAPEPQPRRTVVASPKKPPRPPSMAGAVPVNGENNGNDLPMKDIRISEQPQYEVIEPSQSSPTLSELPKDSSTPRTDPGSTRDSSPRPQPPTMSSKPRSQPPPSAGSPAQMQPARPGSRRYEPDKASLDRSEPDGTSPTQSEHLSKGEIRKKKLENKLKATGEPNEDADDYDNSFMQRFKRPIMLVIFLLLVALSIALGIGARSASMVSIAGAFSSNQGKECVRLCRHADRYPNPPLVVIAMNGFQSGFFKQQSLLRNIARLAECGVHGDTIPSYPSTAIPNLYSMVTGIYPAFHGKAGDWLRAYGLNETVFGPASHPNTYSRMDPKWFQLNGLWGVAADHGLLTASHSWIGREGDIDEERPASPSYYQTFDSGVNYKARMQTVLNWLHLDKEERPQLVTVYFEDPGITAQQYGLTSKQTMDSLAKVDSAIGLLLDTLYDETDLGCVNVMVVSTGGLAERNCDRVYYLKDDLQNVDDYTLFPDTVTTVGRITATDQSPQEMDMPEEILEHLQCKVDHGRVFTSRLLPVQLHSSNALHKEDVVVIMDEGWTFAKQQEGYDRANCKGFSDGFIPNSKAMQGMFVGFGKSFKTGKTISAVKNVDLYNLMTELINVTSRANNGTAGILSDVLMGVKAPDAVAVEFFPLRDSECVYPANDNEYARRTGDSATGCTCTMKDAVFLREKDNNLQSTNVGNSIQRNAPFGLPKVLRGEGSVGQDYCRLYQSNFITAFENKLQIPVFETFTTLRNSATVAQTGNCLRYDVRLLPENTPKCSSYSLDTNPQLPLNIVRTFLYDPSLADSEDNQFNSMTSANIVPQYSSFRRDVWLPLAERIRHWAHQANRSAEMNVVMGPVYDWNSDTLRDTYREVATSIAWVLDTPLPSHYFLVATRCSEDMSLSMCPLQSLQVLSLVLPHTNGVKICRTFDDYLSTYLTTLQDVELITGLYFLPDLSTDEDLINEMLRFKARMPSMSNWIL